VSLAVEEGTMRMLRAEQLDGAVELRLAHAASSAGEPFANQARVHSRISVLLASGDQITLSNPAKDGPAKAVSGFFNIYA
jgi:hypothetical protein